MNTSNSDNLIGTINLPHRNVQNNSSFDTLITLQKVTYTESSDRIKNKRTKQNNITEDISSHQNSAEIIDHALDENGINLFNTKEAVDIKSINSINETNQISINDDENYIHEYYAPFYYQITMNMYLQDQNMIHQN